jgi:hypothetical protein
MATYLVVHTPKTTEEIDSETEVRPPTRLKELALDHGGDSSDPRWIKTWSPDLHDERLFSLWDATDAQKILAVIETYGFLDDLTPHPVRVQEWGPDDVVSSDE